MRRRCRTTLNEALDSTVERASVKAFSKAGSEALEASIAVQTSLFLLSLSWSSATMGAEASLAWIAGERDNNRKS